MAQKEKIVEEALKLFQAHGIKSITVDRIAKHLRMSKRTIYEIFPDKTAIVNGCIELYQTNIRRRNQDIIEASPNVMLALLRLKDVITTEQGAINTNFFADIQHFYPQLIVQENDRYGDFSHGQIVKLAEKGILEGVFRNEMNTDIFAKTLLALLRLIENTDLFQQYYPNRNLLVDNTLLPYIKGICTPKGIYLVEYHEKTLRETLNATQK